jgi:tetratricopeptide (TPR) repeat protein
MFALATLLALATAPVLEQAYFANQYPAVQLQAQARVAANGNDPLGHAYLARLAYKQGRWADARKELGKAGQRELEAVLAWGDFLLYTGASQAAIGYFQEARKLDPGHSHAIYGLGAAYLDTGRFQEAYDLARGAEAMAAREGPFQHSRVLSILGGAQGLKANRGNLADKLRFGPQVRGTLERAMAVAPGNPNAIYAVGRFYLEAPAVIGGNPAKAVPLLEKAGALDPCFFLGQAYLARAYQATGKPARARDVLAAYRKRFAGLPAPMREVADLR